MFYDQYTSLYGSYKVHASLVKFTIINKSGSEPLDFVMTPTYVTSSWSDMMQAREEKNSFHKIIGASDGGKDITVLKRFYKHKNLVKNFSDQAWGTLNTSSDPPSILYLKYAY